MPTETFLRLPEEKRNRFLDAAWKEFTHASLEDASINQIIRRAGIPRGSFYQYFTDKGDLFAYLQEIVLNHFISEYRGVAIQAGGDLFQTQLLCFDRMVSQGRAGDPLFDRCLRVLRLNPQLLPQVALEERLVFRMLDEVWDHLNIASFRSQERELIGQTFALALVSLAAAVMDCLSFPTDTETHRRGLLLRLDIIKNGCLAADRREYV